MPKQLLVADDSKTMLQAVQLTLAGEDYQVHVATDGEQALGMARQLSPAIILADFAMPRMDGYELCRALKSDAALSRTPVMLLTGNSGAYDEARGAACGIDGHIAKPWDSQALIDRIAELLSRPARQIGAAPAAAAPPPPGNGSDGIAVDVSMDSPFGAPDSFGGAEASPFAAPDPFAQAYGGGGASPFSADGADPFAPPGESAPSALDTRGLMDRGAPAAAPPRPAPAAAPPRPAPAPPRPAPAPVPAPAAARPAAPAPVPAPRPITAPPPRPAPAPAPPPVAAASGARPMTAPPRPAPVPPPAAAPPRPAPAPAPAAARPSAPAPPRPVPAPPPRPAAPPPSMAPSAVVTPPRGREVSLGQTMIMSPSAPTSAPTGPVTVGGDGVNEAVLREALAHASRELIEKVIWEVVPDLAESIIREELARLLKDR